MELTLISGRYVQGMISIVSSNAHGHHTTTQKLATSVAGNELAINSISYHLRQDVGKLEQSSVLGEREHTPYDFGTKLGGRPPGSSIRGFRHNTEYRKVTPQD